MTGASIPIQSLQPHRHDRVSAYIKSVRTNTCADKCTNTYSIYLIYAKKSAATAGDRNSEQADQQCSIRVHAQSALVCCQCRRCEQDIHI